MFMFSSSILMMFAQTSFLGIPTARLLAWVMIGLMILLALLIAVRIYRWVARTFLTGRPASPKNVRPEQPPVSVESALASQNWKKAEETSASVRPVGELNPEVASRFQPSRAAQQFPDEGRSWSQRSLFGNSSLNREEPLPKVASADIPFRDTSDFRFGSLTPVLSELLPESDTRKQTLKKELVEAGHYTPHAYENLAAVRYLGLMLPLLFFGLLLVFGPPQLEPIMLILMVGGAILGWSLPRLLVRSKATKRQKEIELALPDVIDLLNMCVSQGMTLRSALARVSWEISETYPAMAEELRIVAEQANLGTLEHALTNLNERVNVPELHSLNSLLIQTERMGTNVSDSLTEYSDAMRSTLQQRADQKANAATFKLLFPTVLCLMPAVYFFLLGPAVVELSEFFSAGGLDRYRQVNLNNNNQDQ